MFTTSVINNNLKIEIHKFKFGTFFMQNLQGQKYTQMRLNYTYISNRI